jgi:hypothetical protein
MKRVIKTKTKQTSKIISCLEKYFTNPLMTNSLKGKIDKSQHYPKCQELSGKNMLWKILNQN